LGLLPGPWGFRCADCPSNSRFWGASHGLLRLSRVSLLWRRCLRSSINQPSAASSLAVSSPSAYSRCWPATYPGKEPPLRLRCLPSVSHALKASIRPTPASRVKAGPAHGVSPSGSYPLTGRPTFSGDHSLLRLAESRPFASAGSAVVGFLGIAHQHVPT
jgi:hypothetical protein